MNSRFSQVNADKRLSESVIGNWYTVLFPAIKTNTSQGSKSLWGDFACYLILKSRMTLFSADSLLTLTSPWKNPSFAIPELLPMLPLTFRIKICASCQAYMPQPYQCHRVSANIVKCNDSEYGWRALFNPWSWRPPAAAFICTRKRNIAFSLAKWGSDLLCDYHIAETCALQSWGK